MFTLPLSTDLRRGSIADVLRALDGLVPQSRRGTPCDGITTGTLTDVISSIFTPHNIKAYEYGGRTYYTLATIYSYRTPVATLVRNSDDSQRLLLWSDRRYSRTTSHHVNSTTHALRALAHRSVAVPLVELSPLGLVEAVTKDCEAMFDRVLRAREWAQYRWNSYRTRFNDALYVVQFFNLDVDLTPPHKSPNLTPQQIAKLTKLRLAGIIN